MLLNGKSDHHTPFTKSSSTFASYPKPLLSPPRSTGPWCSFQGQPHPCLWAFAPAVSSRCDMLSPALFSPALPPCFCSKVISSSLGGPWSPHTRNLDLGLCVLFRPSLTTLTLYYAFMCLFMPVSPETWLALNNPVLNLSHKFLFTYFRI